MRRQYQERFQWILVDEYQDTNPVQYNLIRLLAGERKNLCVVGDDDQSIYSWRGADIRNILEFEKDFPGVKVVRLEQNYRSTATILAAAGEVVKQNFGRKGKTLWTENPDGEKIRYERVESDREEARFVCREIGRLQHTAACRWRRWRSSTAPTPSRAWWRRRWSARRSPTTSSAASVSMPAWRSRISWPTCGCWTTRPTRFR